MTPEHRKRKEALHVLRRRLRHLEKEIQNRGGRTTTPRDFIVHSEAAALRLVLGELGALGDLQQ